MSGGRNPILTRVFAIVGIVVVSLCTWATLALIYDLWYPPFFDKGEDNISVNPKVAEMKALSAGLSGDKEIIYSINDVLTIPINFHAVKPYKDIDKVNYCITCHGNVPHMISVDKRAYRNMHSTHITCETCHIRGNIKPTFVWVNIETGDIKNSLEIKQKLTTSEYKIYTTYSISKLTKYDKGKMISDANELLKIANTLSKDEREKSIKPFHEGLLDEKKALDCVDCHDANSGLIPLQQLGYSKERVYELNNSEIIGLLTKYKEFYIPTFLTPDEDDNSDIEDVLISPRKGK